MARLSDSITYGNHAITGDVTIGGVVIIGGVIFEQLTFTGGGDLTVSGSYPDYVFTADNTTYQAGSGISLTGTTFNVDNPFNPSGTYSGLRAQATTKEDVGLSSVPNHATYSTSDTYTKTEVANEIAAASTSFPAGFIVLWSGSVASIPVGWVLCDGSNSTPDLRNKFVIGAGSSYSVGATGGSKDAVVISHSHTASTDSAGNHSHSGSTNTAGAHTHVYQERYYNNNGAAGGRFGTEWRNRAANTSSAGSHSHTLSITSAGSHSHSVSVSSSGESGVDKNLPPYLALAYIMKT